MTTLPVEGSRPSWRRTIVRIGVLYTVVTLVGSGYALAVGQTSDTHEHLLLRFAFVVVGIGAFDLYDGLRRRFPAAGDWLLGAPAYGAAVVVILAGMWLWGAAGGDLHPDAFRDGFINFTAVGLVLAAIVGVRRRYRPRVATGHRRGHHAGSVRR